MRSKHKIVALLLVTVFTFSFGNSQDTPKNIRDAKNEKEKIETDSIIENKNKFPKLRLEDAIKYGLDNNQKLKAAFNKTNAASYNYKSAFTTRLPKIYAEANYSYLEANSARPATQSNENAVTGGIRISQVIFNSDLNTEIFSRKIGSRNAELRFRELTNETIQGVVNSYLAVIQNEARLKIVNNNKKMLEEFLEISQFKYKVGSSGVQDVYRFEAELAKIEGEVALAEANLRNSKYNLNKVLNLNVNTEHTFSTGDEISNIFTHDVLPITAMNKNPSTREEITKFLALNALKNSNNAKIAENALEEIENRYKNLRNSRFIPQIEGFARYNKDNIGASGKSLDFRLASDRDSEYWTAGISARLPLFTSGEITYAQRGLNAQREAINNEKNAVIQEVETAINSDVSKVLAAYTVFRSSERTKNAARKYLDIVSDQYREGLIGITELLEARNTSLSAEMANIVANYDFYNSIVSLEKNYGEFMFMKDALEKGLVQRDIQRLIER